MLTAAELQWMSFHVDFTTHLRILKDNLYDTPMLLTVCLVQSTAFSHCKEVWLTTFLNVERTMQVIKNLLPTL